MVVAGLITGFLAVAFAVSDAAFIFSGNLTRYLPIGIVVTLSATAILAVVTGYMSSVRGLIALPQEVTVASLATIAGSVYFALPFSASEPQKIATVIVAIALSSAATGVFLFAMGAFRLGRLVRYVPVPVVGGFLAGMGCLIFVGSFGVATGISPSMSSLHALWEVPAVVKSLFAILFAVALWIASERTRSPIAAPVTIVLFTVLFHAIGQISGYTIDELTKMGWFLKISGDAFTWPPISFSDLTLVDWRAIVPQVFTIATMMLVSAMAVLMNISGIELVIGKDADIDRELKATGVANAVSGACGGVAGFHGITARLLNLKVGGDSRHAGLLVAGVCLVVMLFGTDLLVLVPLPLFGGLLLWVAAILLKQWLLDTFYQLTGGEFTVIILMALVINAAGFEEGLITGLVAGIVLFAVDYSRVDIVKTRLTGETFHSKRTLSEEWRSVLRDHGSAIVILRLQGYIFFGTAHQFVESIRQYVDKAETPMRFLVLDLRRTTGLDTSAAVSFVKLEQLASTSKFKLVLTEVPDQVGETLKRANVGTSALTPVRQFRNLDVGLQWCEEKLVYRVSPDLAQTSSVSIKERLVDDLIDEEAAQIMLGYMQQMSLEAGDVLIEQGTQSQDLYFIESGSMAVQLRTTDGQSMRLSSAEAGSFVGEISFYLGQERSASVVCEQAARVWRLSLVDFHLKLCRPLSNPQSR